MSNLPSIGRLGKWGSSLALVIPKAVTDQLTWRRDDRIAVRVAGEKLILERVPLEKLSILRTGEAGGGGGV